MLLYKPDSKYKKSTGKYKEEEKRFSYKDHSQQKKYHNTVKNAIDKNDGYEEDYREEEAEGKRGRYRHRRGQPKLVYRPKEPSS